MTSISKISAVRDEHSVVLKSDGTVWAWGNNNHVQLGDNSWINRWTPVQVTSF
jgi:alpha-tubulin suppressor-like RCC1 family protein